MCVPLQHITPPPPRPQDSCRDLLAALIAPSQLCIWNADTGTKISTMSFSETVVSMAMNPFDSSNFIGERLTYICTYSVITDSAESVVMYVCIYVIL